MEFTYRISERDYVQGWKMSSKRRRGSFAKAIAFWAFLVACLLLLFAVVSKNSHRQEPADQERTESQASPAPAPLSAALTADVEPFLLMLAVWAFLFVFWIPHLIRRNYRRDTNCQGEITATIDPQSIAIRSTVGSAMQASWNVFKDWQEKDGVILLRYPSTTSTIVVIRQLTEAQRLELRDILSAVLPKK